MRSKVENDRRIHLTSMVQIKEKMITGIDKNVYVEPTIWTSWSGFL